LNLGAVRRGHAPSVEDPDRIGRIVVRNNPYEITNVSTHLLGVRRLGGDTGADRPDRLVGDGDPGERLGGSIGERNLQLGADERRGPPRSAGLQVFADAQNRSESGVQRGGHLARDQLVGFAKDSTSLGMTDDHVVAQFGEHHG
jgi:hypothetical protein